MRRVLSATLPKAHNATLEVTFRRRDFMCSCPTAPAHLLAALLLCVLFATQPTAHHGAPAASSSADQETSFVDLTRARIVTPETLSVQERTAVRVLVEEVEKRTNVRLPVASQWPADAVPVIALGPFASAANWAAAALRGAGTADPAPGAE